MQEYDVIIIGGGSNGLTCGAYLAKAGARTLILEKKHEAGGGLYTDDFATPFRFNLHATYMLLAELMPPYQDLDLERYSVRFFTPDVQAAFTARDGRSLVLYRDPQKTLESIGRLSPEDVDPLRQMLDEFKVLTDEILIPSTYIPPIPVGETAVMLGQTSLGRRLAEMGEMSPNEIIESYGIKDPFIRAALLYLACVWGIHPNSGGVGYMVPLYVNRMMQAALVQHGSHSLASGLISCFAANGGKVLDWAEVERIVLSNGKTVGVALKDGREFGAKAIVSTLSPEQTFLRLIGEAHLPWELAEAAKAWQWEEWSYFTLHMGIKGEPPGLSAAKANPDAARALFSVIGYETPEDLEKHIEVISKNQLPGPAGHLTCTTLHDPSQASSGPYGPLHTLRWESWAPYRLEGSGWDEAKKAYSEKVIERLKQVAPNLADAKILFSFAFSPLDIERRLVSMERGSIKHGAYISTQMGYLRPNPDCSSYRTPVPGLYLAGSSVYPGGMITLGPGYNAAGTIVQDLGLKTWWSPPDYVIRARNEGYIT
jgi:phytoene dehydrogenase-like protein